MVFSGEDIIQTGDTEYLIMSFFRFSISLRTAAASLASYDDFRKRMTSNIEQLTGKAPRSKSVDPEGDISKEQPKGPTKMGLKIKTVFQLNEESRLACSVKVGEESNISTTKRMKTEEEMEMPSEEKTSLPITEMEKVPEVDPIESQYLKTTQDGKDEKMKKMEKFIQILSEKKGKHSPINDRQTSMSVSPSMTSTSNSSSACESETSTNCDSETDSRLEQAYDPFRPLSPCGSASPYDPASPTESATSDSSIELLEPKCLAKRLKKLAKKRKGSFDALLAPPIIFCPDISPSAETFGEIDTYASFLETEDDANMSSSSPPQDDCGTTQKVGELDLKVEVTCESENDAKDTIKKEGDSLSSSKGRLKANASGDKEHYDKILVEVKTALKPSLEGGKISKSVHAKILTKAAKKVYCSRSKEINKPKIRKLIHEYVEKYQKQAVTSV